MDTRKYSPRPLLGNLLAFLIKSQVNILTLTGNTVAMRVDRKRPNKQYNTLTHDHDVSVSQNGPMCIGGFTLINSTVELFGIF